MDEILHRANLINIDFGGRGGRWGIDVHLRACCLGGAGFCPSAVSGLGFSHDVMGVLGQSGSGSTKLFDVGLE